MISDEVCCVSLFLTILKDNIELENLSNPSTMELLYIVSEAACSLYV